MAMATDRPLRRAALALGLLLLLAPAALAHSVAESDKGSIQESAGVRTGGDYTEVKELE
jgi:hypothetical protein